MELSRNMSRKHERYSAFTKLFSLQKLHPPGLPTTAINVGSDPEVPPGGTLVPTRCFRKSGHLAKLEKSNKPG